MHPCTHLSPVPLRGGDRGCSIARPPQGGTSSPERPPPGAWPSPYWRPAGEGGLASASRRRTLGGSLEGHHFAYSGSQTIRGLGTSVRSPVKIVPSIKVKVKLSQSSWHVKPKGHMQRYSIVWCAVCVKINEFWNNSFSAQPHLLNVNDL